MDLVLCWIPVLKEEIAGSQVTLKLFFICSYGGENYPLQCLVRC